MDHRPNSSPRRTSKMTISYPIRTVLKPLPQQGPAAKDFAIRQDCYLRPVKPPAMFSKIQLLVFGALFAFINGTAQQRPNILFIFSDDHAYQAISAYGGPLATLAPTPQIDRIAQAGRRFDRCLVTNSICGPSRAVILTGKYSHLNGFLANEYGEKFDGSQTTFPKLLQSAGYRTAMIGKWHLNADPTGFDYWDILPGQGHYYGPDFINAQGRYNLEGYTTDIITDKSLNWLKENGSSDKPFLLMMQHKAPHRTWDPGPEEINKYNGVTFPEPATLFDDYAGRGQAAHDQDMTIDKTMRLVEDLKMWPPEEGRKRGPQSRMTMDQLAVWDAHYEPIRYALQAQQPEGKDLVRWKYQQYMQDYLACIAGVDKSVGEVLDYLEASGLDKNTIVVYCSDQGFYLGEHGWFDKRFMFEESYRTPLLVRWPGQVRAGAVNKDLVSNLDLAQTFLEIAGVAAPKDMQGASLVPLLKGQTPGNWRKEHYYHYYEYPGSHSVKRHYGISTERYKLMHFYFDIDEWELYDLQADPQEMRNVYNEPAYAKVRKKLHKRLQKLRVKYQDTVTEKLPAKP